MRCPPFTRLSPPSWPGCRPCSPWRISPIRICRCRRRGRSQLLGQARHRLSQLVAQPRASACARGAGRHRGRHQGAEARPHRADRRPRERRAAAGIPPRRRLARGVRHARPHHRHSRQPRRLCRRSPWAESLGLWGAYMAGDGQPPAERLRRLPDLAPARRRRADRPVDRRAEAAAAGDRRPWATTQIARAEQLLAETRPRGPVPRSC